MNSFNLAIRNIKKSVGDYTVYFLTLILGVAIFYVFNSVGEQSIVREIAGSGYEIIEILLLVLEAVSVVVAFVLGFLIIYANHFLIRRRKKEFGVYMLLGMGKKNISKIIIHETVLIGAFSLVIGLVIGVLVSSFMSIIVGKIFDADMSAFVFEVSNSAIIKTIINFVVMYLIVIIFHSVTITKYKLIDLLSADKKTEKQVFKNPIIAFVVFIFAAIGLGYAYYRVGFHTSELNQKELIRHIVIGIVTTLLIFWSLSGFLLTVLRSFKKMYHKNLNSFVIRQFCNSINSSAITMGIICLMLFMTICTFSSGFSVAHQMQENIRNLTPVDYSIIYPDKTTIENIWNENNINPADWAAANGIEIPIYKCDSVTWGSSLGDKKIEASKKFPSVEWNTLEEIMRVSDYNKLADLYGKEIVDLEEDEFAVVCNFKLLQTLRNETFAEGKTQQIGDFTLSPARAECIEGFILMSGSNINSGVIIVPDKVVDESKNVILSSYMMAGDYSTTNQEKKEEIDRKIVEAIDNSVYTESVIHGTKIFIRESNNGLTIMVAFVIIYIGIVFLIASAALLALKALSESIDSIGKYSILKKIGSDANMLRRALFVQIAVYFILPLVVAIIHSFIGLKFAEYALSTMVQEGVFWGACVTSVIMIILYGGYMLATYKGSKKIVDLD